MGAIVKVRTHSTSMSPDIFGYTCWHLLLGYWMWKSACLMSTRPWWVLSWWLDGIERTEKRKVKRMGGWTTQMLNLSYNWLVERSESEREEESQLIQWLVHLCGSFLPSRLTNSWFRDPSFDGPSDWSVFSPVHLLYFIRRRKQRKKRKERHNTSHKWTFSPPSHGLLALSESCFTCRRRKTPKQSRYTSLNVKSNPVLF